MSEVTQIKEISKLTPYQRWEAEIAASKKDRERFVERAKKTTDRYLDERDAIDADKKKFNVFWTNTNIMKSALYSQIPKASVSRKYSDYRDQVARVAALTLERMLQTDLNDPLDKFDGVMRQTVFDRLVPGFGAAWLRLETDTEDIPESEGGQLSQDSDANVPGPKGDSEGFPVPAAEQHATSTDPEPVGQAVPLKKIKDQRVAVDYVHWEDFFWSPCRVWAERRWVARRVYMTYDEVKRRFGEDKAKLTSFGVKTYKDANGRETKLDRDIMERAEIYEIWDRQERKCNWWSPGCPEMLDTKDDYLHLQSFEPCPMPMFANLTNDCLMPRPDFYMVQDQYYELDQLNARISKLNDAMKVVGVYAKQEGVNLSNMLGSVENTLIPVDNWALFAEKGGVEGVISWLPLDQVVLAHARLMEAREQVKAQIYELTGISDIVRGASKASETLGAQEIKAQFASVRIKDLQDEVARFATDILIIKAEIQVKHFSIDMFIRKSGILQTDNDEFVTDALTLLKSEEGFKWRIKIQPGSMAQADYAMEKKDSIEFLSATSSFMGQALPMTMQIPETKPIILGLLKWAISKFHNASDIEGMLDKQLDAMIGKPPPPPPVDPKIQAAQMKAQQDQQKMQQDMQMEQQRFGMEREKFGMEMQAKQQEMTFAERKFELEKQMLETKLHMEALQKQMDLNFSEKKFEHEMVADQMKTVADLRGQEQKNQLQMAQGEQQLELSKAQGEQALEQGAAAGEQKLELDRKAAAAAPPPAAKTTKPKGKK